MKINTAVCLSQATPMSSDRPADIDLLRQTQREAEELARLSMREASEMLDVSRWIEERLRELQAVGPSDH